MTWKCPDCGVVLKSEGKHPATHDDDGEPDYNAIEEQLAFGPAMGGEISRLRSLREHSDQPEKWDAVYHAYAKVSKEGDFANTRRERNALRIQIAQQRRLEQW